MKEYKRIRLEPEDIRRLHLVVMESCRPDNANPVALLHNVGIYPYLGEAMVRGELPEGTIAVSFSHYEIQKLAYVCYRHDWSQKGKPILYKQKYNGDWESLLKDIGLDFEKSVIHIRDL